MKKLIHTALAILFITITISASIKEPIFSITNEHNILICSDDNSDIKNGS